MKFSIGPDLTVANVLSRIDQEEVFRQYCPGYRELGFKFKSEFRRDSDPSCVVYPAKGKLYYKDYGEQGRALDCIDYVCRKFGVSVSGALRILNMDFGLGLGYGAGGDPGSPPVPPSGIPTVERFPTTINVWARRMEKRDHDFWGQFHIRPATLAAYRVFPISRFEIVSYKFPSGRQYEADRLSYCYYYYRPKKTGPHLLKIYQPKRTRDGKWISNTDRTVVQGEGMLAKAGPLLVVTKSLKDVMVLREMGYEAVAPNSESVFLPEEYARKQMERFERMAILFDNDAGGRRNSKLFSEEWNVPAVEIPESTGCKDAAELSAKFGLSEAGAIIGKILENARKADPSPD